METSGAPQTLTFVWTPSFTCRFAEFGRNE
jgi:hypothetical protein